MILVVPDVHEQIRKLKRLLKKYDSLVSQVIFLGDFMDTFRGLTDETEETIVWLRDNLANPKYKFCWGNHDVHYAFPFEWTICSGYDRRKQVIYGKHLKNTDDGLNNVKLFHWAGTWLCSHAGIHPSLLNPVMGIDEGAIASLEQRALDNLYMGQFDPLFGIGRSRGGWQRFGGVDWLDFNEEFSAIENLNQLVGHTRGDRIRMRNIENSTNYCIDTHLKHVGLIDDENNLTVERFYGESLYRAVFHPIGTDNLFDIEFSTDEEKTWDVALSGLSECEVHNHLRDLMVDSNDEFIDSHMFRL